jgi:hypothetical protein
MSYMRNWRKIPYFSLQKVKGWLVSDKRNMFRPVLTALKPVSHLLNNRLVCLTAASVPLRNADSQSLRLRQLSTWILMQIVCVECSFVIVYWSLLNQFPFTTLESLILNIQLTISAIWTRSSTVTMTRFHMGLSLLLVTPYPFISLKPGSPLWVATFSG